MTDTTKPPTDEDVMADAPMGSASDAGDNDEAASRAPVEEGTIVDSVEALQAEVEQLRGLHQRALADYQNLQRRSREERAELTRLTLGDAIRSFLPPLDDLERALEAVERAAEGKTETGSWLEGIRLVTQKFRGVLQQYGVEEIHALGQPFDPNLHEAVGPVAGPDGQVVHLLQRGYMLNERVIRPAMVMVGNGDDAAGASPAGSLGAPAV